MLNQEQIKGMWNEIKGGIQNVWGQLTDDELDQTKGNFSSIAGLVERKYGEGKAIIKGKLENLLASFDNDTNKTHYKNDVSSFQRSPVDTGTDEPIHDADQEQSPHTFQASSVNSEPDRLTRH